MERGRARGDDVDRRTFLRLAAAGLSSAFVPLAAGACRAQWSQQRGANVLPTPDAPFAGIVDHGLSLSVPQLRARFENVVQPVPSVEIGGTLVF